MRDSGPGTQDPGLATSDLGPGAIGLPTVNGAHPAGDLVGAWVSMPLSAFATSLAAQVGLQPPPGPVPSDTASQLARILSALPVVAIELAGVAALCAGLYAVMILLLRAAPIPPERPEWRDLARLRTRHILVSLLLAMVTGVLCANGYLLARGVDVPRYTADLIRSIPADTWITLTRALPKLALAVGGLLIVIRLSRRVLRATERRLSQRERADEQDETLSTVFAGLERTIVNIGWMLVVVFASMLFAFPDRVTGVLLVAVRIYVVLAIGLVVIRSTAVIVETLDALGYRYAERREWQRYYDPLRALLPTFRACLEYALWIGVGSLVLAQLTPMQGLAAWGPRVIQAIAIFFAGRVLIELGRLEIAHRMLPAEGLEDTERRRRETMIPLVRSAFGYAVYFGTAVVILSLLGFNPMPFLAGAGLLGLVIGFGAQSLINDVVSGFFILFENIYLVGDIVEVGPARGVVEAIEFRTTRIRDAEGRVHVIRNGDMKALINYSKDYGVAIVAVEVPYEADLQRVFASLREAGRRLRAECREVLAETQIDGITAFGPAAMTVKTSTRVRPGHHERIAAALRLLINETFDVQPGARTSLIGRDYARHVPVHR
jgi:small-conductance mechanosensitive channel